MESFSDVILPLPLDHPFTYEVPSGMSLSVGVRVKVVLGRSKKIGVVLGLHSKKPPYPVKLIEEALDEKPLLFPLILEWLTWAGRYYLTPLGEVFKASLPSLFFSLSAKGIAERKPRLDPLADHWREVKEIKLTPAQQKICEEIKKEVAPEKFTPVLLHGVTGSGKTEIYIELAKELLRKGKEVIFLVPEIGLTPQIVGRLKDSFSGNFGLSHSGLTPSQRLASWMKAKKGEIRLMVGTRSALFTPFENLGGIIIDEEHDSSYKQEERFRYHARDLALVRGKMQNCLVLLGSATPSLETMHNVHQGKYRYFSLPSRFAQSPPPQIQVIDMSTEERQRGLPLILSRPLYQAIGETLKNKEQAIILLNRRGFARAFFCLACKKGLICPNCTVTLVFHKKEGSKPSPSLRCHYCDERLPLPSFCPLCQSFRVTLIGQGTETIEEELATFFPKARIGRLDRDTVGRKGVLLKTLSQLRKGEIDILVGTQMIAKGHDIAAVTLVGVINIDSSLAIPDFRSSERTFQLLMQVAGRSGRGERPGRVIVQAYSPSHYSIQIACGPVESRQDPYAAFYEKEIVWRKELDYPPCGRLIQFVFSSPSRKKIDLLRDALRERLEGFKKKNLPLQILGPAPAPLEMIRGNLRYQLLLKGKSVSPLRQAASEILAWKGQKGMASVKWAVDVDPVSML